MSNKCIHIIGGGTVSHISTHLALCAPVYGDTARLLHEICANAKCLGKTTLDIQRHLTRMAGGSRELETNADVEFLIKLLVANPSTKIVFLSAALCDFEPENGNKLGPRLHTRETPKLSIDFVPAKKIVGNIRKRRKDIFAVAFKATSKATPEEQYIAGLNLLKEASVNLVFANDVVTKLNMVITPEEARYHETTNRVEALQGLVEMALLRSQLTFTRSTVVDGKPVPWDSELVPNALRRVVDYCVSRGAYKPFRRTY
jgi:DNA / pantothenate metabolism flavoprotein